MICTCCRSWLEHEHNICSHSLLSNEECSNSPKTVMLELQLVTENIHVCCVCGDFPNEHMGTRILTACSNTKFQHTNSHKRVVVYLSLISFTAGAHAIQRAGSTSGFVCIVGQEIWDRVTLPLHLTGSFVSTKQVYHTTTAAGMGGMRVHSHVNGKVSAGTMYQD